MRVLSRRRARRGAVRVVAMPAPASRPRRASEGLRSLRPARRRSRRYPQRPRARPRVLQARGRGPRRAHPRRGRCAGRGLLSVPPRRRGTRVVMQQGKLSNQNFAALFDAAPDAIIVVNGRGTIEFANRKTEDLFGWAPEELVGQPVEQLVPARLRGRHVGDRDAYIASPTLATDGYGPRAVRAPARRQRVPGRDQPEPARTKRCTGGRPASSATSPSASIVEAQSAARPASPAQRGREHPGRICAVRRRGSTGAVQQHLSWAAVPRVAGRCVGASYEQLLDRMLADGVFEDGGEPRRLRASAASRSTARRLRRSTSPPRRSQPAGHRARAPPRAAGSRRCGISPRTCGARRSCAACASSPRPRARPRASSCRR